MLKLIFFTLILAGFLLPLRADSSAPTSDDQWHQVHALVDKRAAAAGSQDRIPADRDLIAAAEKFVAKFPDDPHGTEVKIAFALAADEMRRWDYVDGPTSAQISKVVVDSLPTDTDSLSKLQQGQIRTLQISLAIQAIPDTAPDASAWDPIQEMIGDFDRHFGADFSPDGPGKETTLYHLKELELKKIDLTEDLRDAPILRRLSEDADSRVADTAKFRLKQATQIVDLKSKPMELKFEAADGTSIDLAQMRGKVVMLDFWATWCEPCVAEIPNVQAVYQKYHGQGFEVLGISLDEDKNVMLDFVKTRGVPWPQYCDGGGWQNAIGRQYNILLIPTVWLIDKKGMLVTTHGSKGLDDEVAKLLQAP